MRKAEDGVSTYNYIVQTTAGDLLAPDPASLCTDEWLNTKRGSHQFSPFDLSLYARTSYPKISTQIVPPDKNMSLRILYVVFCSPMHCAYIAN